MQRWAADMDNLFTGGCRCGQVRYSVSAEPVTQMICHCKGCLKRTGPYMGGVFVPTTGIEITGDYNRSQDIGGTGSPLESYTCSSCGSVFAVYSHAVPLMTIITANSLDDQSKLSALSPGTPRL